MMPELARGELEAEHEQEEEHSDVGGEVDELLGLDRPVRSRHTDDESEQQVEGDR